MTSVTISRGLAIRLVYMLARQARQEVQGCRAVQKPRGVYYQILCQQIREMIDCGGSKKNAVRDIFRGAFRSMRSADGGAQ